MNTRPSDSAIAQAFRKGPVVIEAAGPITAINFLAISQWCGGQAKTSLSIIIPTLEGDMRAEAGDWIIKGVKGEFYPCKPDIFAATYEPVEIEAERPEQVQRKFQGVGHLEETGYIPSGSAAEHACRDFVEEDGPNGKPTGYLLFGKNAERADAELTTEHARVLQDIPKPDEPGGRVEDLDDMADTIDQIRWSRYALNREQLPNDVKVALAKASRLLRRLAAKPQAVWHEIEQMCMVTEAVTPDPGDIRGTLDRLIDYHVALNKPHADQDRKDAVETKYVRTAFAYSEAVDKLCAANVEVLSLKQDAERLDYIFECEIKAAREYIPVDAEQYKAKRRIKIDTAMAQEAGNEV